MHKAQIDIPVAIIFFNRDDTLEKVFERVKEAKPSNLFFIQDGPRKNHPEDELNIEKCRSIVNKTDWDCQVYENYSDVNMGCGQRVYSGITWAFKYVERLVILEDDCVIEPSFLKFCNELLEKYKFDERVSMISALNHFNEWDCCGNDYCFTNTAAIGAWATWKRVWDEFDLNMSDFEDPYIQKTLPLSYPDRRAANATIKHWKDTFEATKKGHVVKYWGAQYDYHKSKSKGLGIVPSHTLSSNIGFGDRATFSGSGIQYLRKSIRQWFFQETYPMRFPLKHPKAIIADIKYDICYYKISYPNWLYSLFSRVFYHGKKIICSVLKSKR